MTGYTKLFSSILTSTIWDQDSDTRILWITMLALSDRNGEVGGSIPGLAHQARLPVAKVKAALTVLSNPDEYSRSKEHEGRRIKEIDGGWQILNRAKYREKMSADERREYKAKWARDDRVAKKCGLRVDTSGQTCTPLTQSESESESYKSPLTPASGGLVDTRPRPTRRDIRAVTKEMDKLYKTKVGCNDWDDNRIFDTACALVGVPTDLAREAMQSKESEQTT